MLFLQEAIPVGSASYSLLFSVLLFYGNQNMLYLFLYLLALYLPATLDCKFYEDRGMFTSLSTQSPQSSTVATTWRCCVNQYVLRKIDGLVFQSLQQMCRTFFPLSSEFQRWLSYEKKQNFSVKIS